MLSCHRTERKMKRTVTKRHSSKPSFQRHTASLPDRWDLSSLLEHPQNDLDSALKRLDELVSQFEGVRSRLSPDMAPERLLDILRASEGIARQSAKLSAYAYLWFSENTKDLEARAFKTRVEERLTGLQNRLLFFDLWWQGVDDGNAGRLLDASGDYRY